MADAVNQVERERWNNALYAELWPKRERLTTAVTPTLLAAVAARRGERILDVGCGLGPTTLALAPLVGPGGRVVGADISEPLLDLARERSQAGGAEQVDFVAADLQTDRVPGGPFDAAVSQFGVMFFDDPGAAFANIRSHLANEGRLAFACWQGPEENPWFPGLALADVAPPPAPPAPGKSPTGPFTLADPDRVRELLGGAGFAAVAITPGELEVEVPDDALLDDAQLVLSRVPAERIPEAQQVAARHLARFRSAPGRVKVRLAFQIVTARVG